MLTVSCPRSSDCVCFEFALVFRDCVNVSRLRLYFATALVFRDYKFLEGVNGCPQVCDCF